MNENEKGKHYIYAGKTNTIPGSIKKVYISLKRRLTSGEIAMVKPVFKDSIDYSQVIIHKKKYMRLVQEDKTIMTPNGEMYLGNTNYEKFKDFSKDDKSENKIWFMHEMAHVWQHQLGFKVRLHGIKTAIAGGYSAEGNVYKYTSIDLYQNTLPDFNFEQQAEIISHYFGAEYLKENDFLPNLLLFRSVLKEFIINPKDEKLLPRSNTNNNYSI